MRLPCLSTVSEPFVSNPFMQSMLVDEEQFVLGLYQDVGVRKLSQRFHVRKVVEFTLKRLFIAGASGVSTSCMPMQVPFC